MTSTIPAKRDRPVPVPAAAPSTMTATLKANSNSSSSSTNPASSSSQPEGETEGFTKVLTREEKRKLRKVEKHRPSFAFDVSQFRLGRKVGVANVRDLTLHLVADGPKPNWIVAEHKGNISHTVLLLIPGLLPEHLGLEIAIATNHPFPTSPIYPTSDSTGGPSRPTNRVPYLPKLFAYGVPVRAPGDNRRMFSVMSTLLNSPLPDAVRKKQEEESKKVAELAKTDDSPPFLYLLTPNQMVDNDYRLPSYLSAGDAVVIPGLKGKDVQNIIPSPSGAATAELDDLVDGVKVRGSIPVASGKSSIGWVETAQAEGPPADGRYPVLAMDCEMVETSKGNELARVSIIDYHTGRNIFDELVKPPDPIIDYRTKWSGMTPERLAHATHTVASIQSALLTGPSALITPHTILLGHSLECDLTALRIRHPLCIDTALLYKHPRGGPYKPALKWLSGKWLGREIQNKEGGHDSEEDARTCVDLLKLKMANGPDFGAFNDTTETIFERISRFIPSGSTSGRTSAVCDYSNTKSGHGGKATTAVKCGNDDEVLDAVLGNVGKHDLTFGRFMDLANVQGWNGDHSSQSATSPSASQGNDSASIQSDRLFASLAALNDRLTKLHAALPRNSALIVLTGHADPLPMLQLAAKRQKWERLMKELGSAEGIKGEDRWMMEDDRELEKRVVEAREGMGFFCVK